MNFYCKRLGGYEAEAWVEDFIHEEMDWQVVSYAKLILVGDKCLIDTIDTPPKYRRRGYATKIVNELLNTFKEIEPIGIVSNAQDFWNNFNMKDGLGDLV